MKTIHTPAPLGYNLHGNLRYVISSETVAWHKPEIPRILKDFYGSPQRHREIFLLSESSRKPRCYLGLQDRSRDTSGPAILVRDIISEPDIIEKRRKGILFNIRENCNKQNMFCWGADGWAKNQFGKRRLGELFLGRQTIGRQQSFQKRRFAERWLGDKDLSSLHHSVAC